MHAHSCKPHKFSPGTWPSGRIAALRIKQECTYCFWQPVFPWGLLIQLINTAWEPLLCVGKGARAEWGGDSIGYTALTAIRFCRPCWRGHDLAVHEGFYCHDGGRHERLSGSGEQADDPAPVLDAPVPARRVRRSWTTDGHSEMIMCESMEYRGTHALEASLKALSIWFLNSLFWDFSMTFLAAWIASLKCWSWNVNPNRIEKALLRPGHDKCGESRTDGSQGCLSQSW